MGSRLRAALFDPSNVLPLIAMVIYLLNRFVVPLDGILPYEFVHFHLADLCGGVVFPAYVNVLCLTVAGKALVNNFVSAFVTGLGCSLCWEVLASCVLGFGTADPIDALMYFIGAFIYLAGFKLAERLRARD